MKKSKAEKQLDKLIEQIYYKHGDRVQISIMDIPKLFNDARQAFQQGKDLNAEMPGIIAKYRKN